MGQSSKGGDSLSVVCHSDPSRIVEMMSGHLADVKSDYPQRRSVRLEILGNCGHTGVAIRQPVL